MLMKGEGVLAGITRILRACPGAKGAAMRAWSSWLIVARRREAGNHERPRCKYMLGAWMQERAVAGEVRWPLVELMWR